MTSSIKRFRTSIAMTRNLATALTFIVAASSVLISFHAVAAESYPPTDPPLPKLVEPGQTEEPAVYRARRAALMKEMEEGVAVFFAEGREDGDGYRQDSDFFYLTGVHEEGAILVLAPKERTYREFLLLPSRDPEAERWTGERDPLSAALRKKYGFEKILRNWQAFPFAPCPIRWHECVRGIRRARLL